MARPSKKSEAAIKGIIDIVTQVDPLWDAVLKRFGKVARTYGFLRVELPILETAELYQHYFQAAPEQLGGLLYSDPDSGFADKRFVLRAAILPSLLRSYVQNKVMEQQPISKWVYFGNVIQQTSAGLVSDYQFSLVVLGTVSHLAEAQSIGALWHLAQSLGLETILEINAIGAPESQKIYQETLKDFLQDKKYNLCDTCNERLAERALDVLRCDNLDCQLAVADAPTVLDFLDQAAHKQFTNVLEALDELQIPYQLSPLYVGQSGASYTTVIIKTRVGNETRVIAEGAYCDTLLQALGGKQVSGFAFTGSLATLVEALQSAQIIVESPTVASDVFLVPLGELASRRSLRLFRDLTAANIRVHDYFGNTGVKNQLKLAETAHAPVALIMGQKEALEELVILRDVKSGMQEIFSYDKIVDEVKKRLGK